MRDENDIFFNLLSTFQIATEMIQVMSNLLNADESLFETQDINATADRHVSKLRVFTAIKLLIETQKCQALIFLEQTHSRDAKVRQ